MKSSDDIVGQFVFIYGGDFDVPVLVLVLFPLLWPVLLTLRLHSHKNNKKNITDEKMATKNGFKLSVSFITLLYYHFRKGSNTGHNNVCRY